MEADSHDVDSLDSRPQSEDSLEHSRDSLGGPRIIMLDNDQFIAAVFVEDVSSLAQETEAAAVEAESCQQVVMVEAAAEEVESGSQEQIVDTEVLTSSDITTETFTAAVETCKEQVTEMVVTVEESTEESFAATEDVVTEAVASGEMSAAAQVEESEEELPVSETDCVKVGCYKSLDQKKGDIHDFQDGTASDLDMQERDPETRIDLVNSFSI